MFLHTLAKTSDTISNATTSTFISCFLMFKKYILREKNKKTLVDGLQIRVLVFIAVLVYTLWMKDKSFGTEIQKSFSNKSCVKVIEINTSADQGKGTPVNFKFLKFTK